MEEYQHRGQKVEYLISQKINYHIDLLVFKIDFKNIFLYNRKGLILISHTDYYFHLKAKFKTS
jgi:hypothetical protein